MCVLVLVCRQVLCWELISLDLQGVQDAEGTGGKSGDKLAPRTMIKAKASPRIQVAM